MNIPKSGCIIRRVEIKIMAHRRGPKIIVYKMRPKKKTRTKNGHRQELTRIMVQSISKDAKTTKAASTSKAKTDKPKKAASISKPKASTTKTETPNTPADKNSSKVKKTTE